MGKQIEMALEAQQALVPTGQGYDYTGLPVDVADHAKAVAARGRTMHRDLIQAATDLGRELIAVKDNLGHGKFGDWLEAEFGASARTARNYMSLAERLGDKSEIVSVLPAATVYELAAPSTPDETRAEVIGKLSSGVMVTPSEVKTLISAGRDKAKEVAQKAKEAERLAKLTPEERAKEQKTRETRAQRAERERREGDARKAKAELNEQRREEAMSDATAILWDGLGERVFAFIDLLERGGFGAKGLHKSLMASLGAETKPVPLASIIINDPLPEPDEWRVKSAKYGQSGDVAVASMPDGSYRLLCGATEVAAKIKAKAQSVLVAIVPQSQSAEGEAR